MPSPNERNPASGRGFEGQHATGQVPKNGNATSTGALSQPDLNGAQNFLDLIDPTASAFRFRTFNDPDELPKDNGHKFHGKLADVVGALIRDNENRRGVFVVINAGGDTDDSITSIRAVFADTDGAPLDPIMRCGLDPHVVIETSPGKYHAHWLVTGLAVDRFRGVQRRIAYRFGTDRKVINPSRVMRLPGFDHHKGEAFRVGTIHESGKPAYTAEEVLEAFPPLAEFPDKAKDKPNKDRSAGASQPPRGSVSSYTGGALRRAAENVASAAEGSRNDTLNREAYSLAGIIDLSDSDIIGALEPAARAAGLSDSEIDATIASGLASGRGRPRETPQPRERSHASGNEGCSVAPFETDDPPPEPAPPIFIHVDLHDLGNAKAELPRYIVDPLIAAGVVTMLGGHGGSGKTMLSLIIGAHVAHGGSWGPYDFNRGRVLFVSLEDPGKRIRATLARVCNHYWLDPRVVAEHFTMIDGTSVEAALAAEHTDFNGKRLIETAAYAELLALAAGFDLIIVDNASDAFDGNENERRQVRKFVRGMLGKIARDHDCAVLLLAHIDKAAARFGGKKNSYSGSTAWHNSARSRLALIDDEQSGLELVHEKNNLGKSADPLRLAWTDRGMLVPSVTGKPEDTSAADALIAGADDEDVFEAIKAAIEAGATITTAKTGSCNTHNVLTKFDRLPKHLRKGDGKERFWAALTRLQRFGRIVVEDYDDAYRHPKKRWALAVEVTV